MKNQPSGKQIERRRAPVLRATIDRLLRTGKVQLVEASGQREFRRAAAAV